MTRSDGRIGVDADEPIGSARLAAALASGDAEAIGRALRLDVVLVPLLRGADGDAQIRVFQPDAEGLQLALFSSVAAYSAYLAGDPAREFDLQRGPALTPFLEHHRDRIARVVFDPAGPHPVAAPVDAILDALRPRPDDDEVGWLTETTSGGGASAPEGQTSGGLDQAARVDEVIDFRPAVPFPGWTRLPASDVLEFRDHAIGQLRRGVRRVPRAVRAATAAWIEVAADEAAGGHGVRELGVAVVGPDATPVLFARFWLPVSDPSEPSSADPNLPAEHPPAPFEVDGASAGTRQTTERSDPASPSGRRTVLDIRLPFPDGLGVCLLRFSTPRAGAGAELLRIATPLVADGSWAVRSRP